MNEDNIVVDYSDYFEQLISLQNSINDNLLDIKKDLKFIRDDIEITEEEQIKIDKQNELLENKLKDEKKKDIEKYETDLQTLLSTIEDNKSLENINQELVQLNKNIVDNTDVNTVGSSSTYLILFSLVGFTFCYMIWRFFKTFI